MAALATSAIAVRRQSGASSHRTGSTSFASATRAMASSWSSRTRQTRGSSSALSVSRNAVIRPDSIWVALTPAEAKYSATVPLLP